VRDSEAAGDFSERIEAINEESVGNRGQSLRCDDRCRQATDAVQQYTTGDLQRAQQALNQAMNDQALRARLSDLGTEPAWDEADTVAKAIAADLMRWGQLARAAKIEVPQ